MDKYKIINHFIEEEWNAFINTLTFLKEKINDYNQILFVITLAVIEHVFINIKDVFPTENDILLTMNYIDSIIPDEYK